MLVDVDVGRDEVVVMVGAGVALGEVILLDDDVVVVSSLQPNQPGVSQVVVDDVEVLVVVVGAEVVDSSRHPHHPGVLQVSVRVRVVVDVAVLALLVFVSVPLSSKYFQV